MERSLGADGYYLIERSQRIIFPKVDRLLDKEIKGRKIIITTKIIIVMGEVGEKRRKIRNECHILLDLL